MAETLRLRRQINVGTTPVAVAGYAMPTGGGILLKLIVGNKLSTAIAVTVQHSDGTTLATILKDAPIPPGGALAPEDLKTVLEAGHSIWVSANVADACDVMMSLAEFGVSS